MLLDLQPSPSQSPFPQAVACRHTFITHSHSFHYNDDRFLFFLVARPHNVRKGLLPRWPSVFPYPRFLSIADWTAYNTENILVVERADPIVTPGAVAGHVHRVIGGSNFGVEIPSSDYLRESQCTSTGIQEDKSAYWFPQMYFQYANGTFELVNGGPVTYYLFPDQAGKTTIFPDNFRMISGNSAQAPPLGSSEQKAVTFKCLDFNGVSSGDLPFLPANVCPSGIRAQLVSPVYASLSNRLSHLLLPRTSKAAGTERTQTLPITNLMCLIVPKDPTKVTALQISR